MAEAAQPQNIHFEGKNIQLFRVRMRGIFKQILDDVSADMYNEIIKEKHSKRLCKLWQDKVLEDLLSDLDEVIVEEKLDEKSTELANIIKQNQLDGNTVAWRPPGNPTEHMRSLDMHEKLKIKKEWEEFVHKKEASVNQLMAEVQAGREEILKLDKRYNSDIDNLRKLNAIEKNIHVNRKNIFLELTQQE